MLGNHYEGLQDVGQHEAYLNKSKTSDGTINM